MYSGTAAEKRKFTDKFDPVSASGQTHFIFEMLKFSKGEQDLIGIIHNPAGTN